MAGSVIRLFIINVQITAISFEVKTLKLKLRKLRQQAFD